MAAALEWLGSGSRVFGLGSSNGVLASQRVALPAWLEAEYIPERIDENLR